jgi:hypothetical protein
MTHHFLTPRICLSAIACVFAIALSSAAQDADILGSWDVSASTGQGQGETRVDVTGTWAFQVETSAGSGTPTMTLKQDGDKLTGHYSGQLGEAPLTGTVKGSAVEFAIDVTVEGSALHIVYSGTAEKDSMKGTVKLGDLGEGTFTAKKKG